MAVQPTFINVDENDNVVLTPVSSGVIYLDQWRWILWAGRIGFCRSIDRFGIPQDFTAFNTNGVPCEYDFLKGKHYMVLSPPEGTEGGELLSIPAQLHQYRVSHEEGHGIVSWHTGQVGDVMLLEGKSDFDFDNEYVLRLEHLATQAELVLAERAEQERRREVQEAAEREENRAIQVAVVSVTASDLIQFVKCWPHIKCRKPNVNRVEMERVVRRWARSKKLNTFKVLSAAEPFYLNWCDAILEHWRIPVEEEEMPTIPPQDVNLVEDFAIAFDLPPSVESKPIEPESYLGDLAPDNSNDMAFGPPVVVESGGRSGFLDPVPTAVGLAGSGSQIRYEALLEDLLGTSGSMLGLDGNGASQVLAALSIDGEIRQSLADQLDVDYELLLDVIDLYRVVVPNKKSA